MAEDTPAIIEAAREPKAIADNTPVVTEATPEVTEATPEVIQAREPVQEQQEQRRQVVVTQDPRGLPSFFAVPHPQPIVASAPLTPATSRFVATPVNANVIPAAATRTLVRASPVATPAVVTTPLGHSLASTVSTGFFHFP